ncbi:universal stress protein [Shinella sp. S4-D37]|uniref:universal stress protein n=1 Tax=Shinella sp. S4-D37 TaxID=3161999 RepID=UPI003467D611
MAFKTVLVVTGSDLGNGDLRMGADLCEAIDAHLAVLAVEIAPPPPIGDYAIAWYDERQAGMEKLYQRCAAVKDFLSSRRASVDIASEYQEEAWTDDMIGRRARYTDIVLVGPDLLSHPLLKRKALEGALFSSGKPVLVVPQGYKADLKPKHVMIAWDSRLEASNAVSRAMDVLIAAKDVHVVLIDPLEGDGGQGAEPGADLATYLTRHGVKITVDRLPSQGGTVAETLRRHAVDTATDMLVMGGYGHSRLRERIFGGVTRSILEEPPLPVLMAH